MITYLIEIERIAQKRKFHAIWEKTDNGILFYIPYNDSSTNVLMGFLFCDDIIRPDFEEVKYITTVYKLLRFYPHDERPDEFSFNLEDI